MGDRQADAHVRLFRVLQREAQRKAQNIEAARQAQLHRWLSQGGQRAIRSGAKAEVFSRHGEKLERESPGGERTQVGNLLDPRLLLTERQRATGNCYGAYAEAVQTRGQTEFMREFVDRSVSGSGGATERHIHMLRMVEVAQKAISEHPAIVYPVGRSRGLGHVGPHRTVKARSVLDGVCIFGWSLQTIAVNHGWVVERMGGANRGKVTVPDRQRKHLAEALRCILDAVDDAWGARGYSVPIEFNRLVVK